MNGKSLHLITAIFIIFSLLLGIFINVPGNASAEQWVDDFLFLNESRWTKGGVGEVLVRDDSDSAYAFSYTGEYSDIWNGPYIRAQTTAFSDFDITGTFNCLADELMINRLLIRILDVSGAQLFAFGWEEVRSDDSIAELALFGSTFDPLSYYNVLFKTDAWEQESYVYSNFFDDLRLTRTGSDISFYMGDELLYTETGLSESPASYIEIAFLKYNDECTNELLDMARLSVSTTDAGLSEPPANIAAITGDRFANLTWSPPLDTGGLPVDIYKIYRGNELGVETYLTTVSSTTSFNDTGLTNGQNYYYRISAVNDLGEGISSESIEVVPLAVPDEPTSFMAIGSDGAVALYWNSPTNYGGSPITGYEIYRSQDNTPQKLISLGSVTTYNDNNVVNGDAYHYWVSAVNLKGEGSLSNEAIVVPGSSTSVPSAPRDLIAALGDSRVSLTWSAPISSGNQPILGYDVYRGLTSDTLTLLNSIDNEVFYLDTGLSNDQTYYYNIVAFNIIGDSLPSTVAMATPQNNSLPTAPQNLTLIPANHTVTLTWLAPISDGGSPILGYRIYRGNQSGAETLLAELGLVYTYTDIGLVNNKMYYYKLAAFSEIGEGTIVDDSSRTPISVEGSGTIDNPDVIPDWTDNFTITSGITTVVALGIGILIMFFFLRGDGTVPPGTSTEGPDKGIDDETHRDGSDEEGGDDENSDLLSESSS